MESAMILAIVGVSLPVFWLGQLLLYVVWYKLHLAPSAGLEINASVWGSALKGKFLLPWITVAVGYAAIYARMLRSNMIETTHEDYMRTARGKRLRPLLQVANRLRQLESLGRGRGHLQPGDHHQQGQGGGRRHDAGRDRDQPARTARRATNSCRRRSMCSSNSSRKPPGAETGNT
jgi:hypothetical protein